MRFVKVSNRFPVQTLTRSTPYYLYHRVDFGLRVVVYSLVREALKEAVGRSRL